LKTSTNIHRFNLSIQIPLASASHKLYYVNYKWDSFRPPVRNLWKIKGPETGYLFPPSAYSPFDCEYCSNPCKLSRYHVGDHSLLWLLICCLNSGIYAVVAALIFGLARSRSDGTR